ncbi:tetratricopeptide repeat protein [Inquilinus ginsengisoli]|uniref:tetratricopeptide repeat protein n=1 Tax=Inquilinus ginsengisoli TaxID=363840 RepID=UPI003D22A53C
MLLGSPFSAARAWRDPAEALTWFRRASIGGNPRGAYNVARLYESGELGTPDPQTAAGWYRVAADAGSEPARTALAKLQVLASGDGAPRIGFVSLATEAGLLVLDRTSVPAARPGPILDSLAAQMVGLRPPGPGKVAMASASAAQPAGYHRGLPAEPGSGGDAAAFGGIAECPSHGHGAGQQGLTEGERVCREPVPVTPCRQGRYSSIDVPHQRARVFW